MKDDAKFCKSCGKPVQEPPFPAPSVREPTLSAASEIRCPSCGRALSPGKKFCAGCGTAVGAAPPMQRMATQQTPPGSPRPAAQPGFVPPTASHQTVMPRAATPVKGAALIAGVALLVATAMLSIWAMVLDPQAGVVSVVEAGGDGTPQAVDGAVPAQQQGLKTDVTLGELVGEWEGTLQFARLEGLEDAQEAGVELTPEQVSEIKDGIHQCTFEIKPNGEWRFDMEVAVLGALDLRSNEARSDSGERYTPPEMILTPADGRFRMTFSEEVEEENMSGSFALDGAVLDEDGLRIDGNLLFEVDGGYAVLVMDCDYSVTRVADAEGE